MNNIDRIINSIKRLSSFKSNIKSAIESKGVTSSGRFDSFADEISSISNSKPTPEPDSFLEVHGSIITLTGFDGVLKSSSFLAMPDEDNTIISDDVIETSISAFHNYESASPVKIVFPNCTKVGSQSFRTTYASFIDLPKAEVLESYAISYMGRQFTGFNLPSVKTLSALALVSIGSVTEIHLPELLTMNDRSILAFGSLTVLKLPKLKTLGYNIASCYKLERIELNSCTLLDTDSISGMIRGKEIRLILPVLETISENAINNSYKSKYDYNFIIVTEETNSNVSSWKEWINSFSFTKPMVRNMDETKQYDFDLQSWELI